MNLRADAHRSKDRRVRGLATALVALALALLSAPLAGAQGVDQYQPSPPPRPGPSPSDTSGSTGGTSGGGSLAAPSSGGSVAAPGAVPVDPGSSSSLSGGTVSGGTVSGGTAAEPVGEARAPGDAADQLESDPLSVAANRPALALGAHASPGGLGTLPLLLGAVAIVAVAALVGRRGMRRPGQGTG
jgi:hypothetical protein